MSRVGDAASGVATFLTEVKTELKKSSWPTRAELIGSTIVIIISVLMLGGFVWFSDTVLKHIVRVIASTAS